MLKFLYALGALVFVTVGVAISQPGQQALTTVLGTDRVQITRGTSPLPASAPLSALRIYGGTNVTCATYAPNITPAATDKVFFIATQALTVTSISEIHTVAAGGASVLQVTKDTATDAPGAGTDLLSTGFDLNGTANTVQTGALVTTAAITLAAGDRLAVDYANTIQSSAGVVVTACMTPAG